MFSLSFICLIFENLHFNFISWHFKWHWLSSSFISNFYSQRNTRIERYKLDETIPRVTKICKMNWKGASISLKGWMIGSWSRRYHGFAYSVDSGGQPGHAPPIIKMGANPFFAPPIIRREFFIFYKKHERKQKQRQRKKNTKKVEYILNEGCTFLRKSCRWKKGHQKFLRIEGFFQNFFENVVWKYIFPKFLPPNIYDKSTPLLY